MSELKFNIDLTTISYDTETGPEYYCWFGDNKYKNSFIMSVSRIKKLLELLDMTETDIYKVISDKVIMYKDLNECEDGWFRN